MNVVLPAPLPPRRPKISPRSTRSETPLSAVMRLPGVLGIGLVWLYRLTLGALFPTTCKYHPSCSEYAIQALRRHGLIRGSALAAWRLLRCNPWSHGGFDPVR